MRPSYFSVKECRYCKSPIPLVEYNCNTFCRLAQSFFARCNNPQCNGLAKYSFLDIDRLNLPPIDGLVPQLDFAKQMLAL